MNDLSKNEQLEILVENFNLRKLNLSLQQKITDQKDENERLRNSLNTLSLENKKLKDSTQCP